MTWRLHDYIHLHLTNVKLADLQSCQNPLKKFDDLLNDDKHSCFITFIPRTQVIWETFETIVRGDNRYVTTFKQVREFVETCFNNHYEKSNDDFDIDEIMATISELEASDDTIVIIEFED